jgi:hypothetical protein
MDAAVCLEDALSREIIRKLRLVRFCVLRRRRLLPNGERRRAVVARREMLPPLCPSVSLSSSPNSPSPKPKQATEAESIEDREIVCEEIFSDITGQLDADARARFGLDGGEGDDDDEDGDDDEQEEPAARPRSSVGGDDSSGRSGSGPPPGGHEPDGWARLEGADGRPLAGVKVGFGGAAIGAATAPSSSSQPPRPRVTGGSNGDGVLRPMGSYVSLVNASSRRLFPAPPSSAGGRATPAAAAAANPLPASAEARGAPHVAAYPPSVAFYEVLAPYYTRDSAAADTVLYFCKRLWGQPYVAPILALLLHRWLLSRPEAGGAGQRQKHVNVLVFGCRQLFNGDVHAGSRRFAPLYEAVATEWALAGVPLLATRWMLPADVAAAGGAGGGGGVGGGGSSGGGGGGSNAQQQQPTLQQQQPPRRQPKLPSTTSFSALPLTPAPSVAHFASSSAGDHHRPGTAPPSSTDGGGGAAAAANAATATLRERLLQLQQQQAASLDALPPAARRNLLALAASYAPYYLGDEPALLRRVLDAFPSPDAPPMAAATAAAGLAASTAGDGGGSVPAQKRLSDAYFDLFRGGGGGGGGDGDDADGEGGGGGGADFAFCEVTDLLASVRTEAAGLPRYLYALAATGAPWWGSSAGGAPPSSSLGGLTATTTGGGGGGLSSALGSGSLGGGGGGSGGGGGAAGWPPADAAAQAADAAGPSGRPWWGWVRPRRPTDPHQGGSGGGLSGGAPTTPTTTTTTDGPGPDPLRRVRAPTRLRLQAELYALTAPGGPRRAPPAVRAAAAATLDALFPMGRRVRGLVRWASRTLHPGEWPMRGGLLLSLAGRLYSAALALVLAQVVALLAFAAQLLLRGKFVVDISALHRAQQQQAARRRLLARQQRRLAGLGGGGPAAAAAAAAAAAQQQPQPPQPLHVDLASRAIDVGGRIHPVAGALIKRAAPYVFPAHWLQRFKRRSDGGTGLTPTAADRAGGADRAFDSFNDLVLY